MNILERMRAGELIFDTDPEYPSLYAEFEKTMKLVAQLNSGYHKECKTVFAIPVSASSKNPFFDRKPKEDK